MGSINTTFCWAVHAFPMYTQRSSIHHKQLGISHPARFTMHTIYGVVHIFVAQNFYEFHENSFLHENIIMCTIYNT